MENRNPEIIKNAKRLLNLNQAESDSAPVQLVSEVKPELLSYSGNSATSGNISVLTTPSENRLFCITGIQAHIIKNAACDTATGSIYVQVQLKDGNNAIQPVRFSILTLTAQDNIVTRDFSNNPLILAPATSIVMTGTFTAGVLVRSLAVEGYYISAY